jgi:predicted nucleic acid-binding protein
MVFMGKPGFRILDTNVLINHLRLLAPSGSKPNAAKEWARKLIELWGTNLIVSPVRVEFLAGAESSEKLKLYLAYLEPFEVVDERQIPRQDWEEAERIAKRVVVKGRRRNLGDCLIKAISLRLNCETVTNDADFDRRVRPPLHKIT